MGISTDLFVSSSGLEDLSCVICQNVFDDPYFVGCKEQHAFCHDCLDKFHRKSTDWRDSKVVCPCCRERVSIDKAQPAPFLRRLVDKHPIRCKFGCAWQGFMNDKHDVVCSLREVGCLNALCDWKGTFVDSDEHEQECGFVEVGCKRQPDCTAVVLRKDQNSHDKVCTAFRCVYYAKDGCPFIGDQHSHAIHLRYCQALHTQLGEINSQADCEQDYASSLISQIAQLERTLSLVHAQALRQGVDLAQLGMSMSVTGAPKSDPDDAQVDYSTVADDEDDDDEPSEEDENSTVADDDDDDGPISQTEDQESGSGNFTQDDDSEDDEPERKRGSSSRHSARSASILIPSAIEKLEQIAKFQSHTSLWTDAPISAPVSSPPPPPPASRPFNLTTVTSRTPVDPSPIASLSDPSIMSNTISSSNYEAAWTESISVNATLATFGPTTTAPRPRRVANGGNASPADAHRIERWPEREVAPGPFKFTSIGQVTQTESVGEADGRASLVRRKASGAGLASARGTPRNKRSRTIEPGRVLQSREASEAETEPRPRWEKSGRVMPDFGGVMMSD